MSRLDQRVLRWFGQVERRVFMADVSIDNLYGIHRGLVGWLARR